MGMESFGSQMPKKEMFVAGAEKEKEDLNNLLKKITEAKTGDYIDEFNFDNLMVDAVDSIKQGNLDHAKLVLNVLKRAQDASLEGVRIAVPAGANLDYLEKDISEKQNLN